jgi:hypothetical protein
LEEGNGHSVEEMERVVSSSLSRLDEEESTEAYLITKLRGDHKRRDLLDRKVAMASCKAQSAYRHFVIHLLNCARIYWTDRWPPMHSEDVLRAKLPGGHRLSSTSVLWDFDGSVVEARNGGEYFTPHRGLTGRTREYRIDPDFAIEFWEEAEGADPNYKLHDEDGETGKRAYGSAALKTTFRDESRNRWGKEKDNLPGGHYSLLDGALRVLSGAKHKIDISEITEMKELLKQEWEQAQIKLEQARADRQKYAHLDEEGGARTEKEADEIREARSKVQSMQTRKEEAEGRYHAILSGMEIITRQAERVEDGVAYIQNAYEVQDISGRFSFKKGGPQGLPAVLKSFAYSMEDVYNYDIKSSQTTGLRQLAEDLRKIGYDIDTEALGKYISRGGKDWVIENYDLPRSLVKRVEHAIKFGASIPRSMEAANAQKENSRWGMPEIAEHVEDYYTDRDEQNRALTDLNEVFGPQVQMIEDLAEGLLTAYWDAHSYAGGRGKGRVMRNHCGITFCKYDHEGGHEARSKAMAWYLQGLEAAYVHAITILSADYDYEVMANEHDGCICVGTIPDAAKKRARELSGFRDALLTDKRFEDEEEVREAADALGRDYPSPPLEPTPEPCNPREKSDTRGPGANVPPSKKETATGSEPVTSPIGSSRPAKRNASSTSATPAGDGPSGSTPRDGDGRASPAPEPHEEELEHEEALEHEEKYEVSDEELQQLIEGFPETGADTGSDDPSQHYGRPPGS